MTTTGGTGVRLIPLGVGEAFTARHYTTCLALGAGDDWLLLDCAHPVRKMMREGSEAAGIPLDLDRVLGVALSHLHADHASGLEDVGFYSHFVLRRRPRLLAHPEVLAGVWDGLLAGGMGATRFDPAGPPAGSSLGDYFEAVPLDESGPVAVGPFAVECRRTVHSVPTTAFRVSALGRTLGFSADTAFDPGLIAWLGPSDLIVHEATTAASSRVHTPYAALAALPQALRSRMRLTHLPDDFDAAASAIEPLEQGRVYPV